MINTTRGLMDETTLKRSVELQDRETEFVVIVPWMAVDLFGKELVRQDVYRSPKDPNDLNLKVNTKVGMIHRNKLLREVQLLDEPNNFTVTVEWSLGGELVRRDVHVMIKYPLEPLTTKIGDLSGKE